MRPTRRVIVPTIVLAVTVACGPSLRLLPTRADVERLRSGSMLTWPPGDQRLGYANIEKIADTALVRRSPRPAPLRGANRRMAAFRYTHRGAPRSIEAFMADLNVVGVIAVKDGAVAVERYADGHGVATPWTAFSVTKSITSMLFGVAIKNGHIGSLDEPVTAYLPELAASSYEGVSLRQLLQMASGVAWNSNLADRTSDTYRLIEVDKQGGLGALLAFMAAKPRVAPPGTTFTYNTAEADLAGAILSRATKRTLAEYLSEHIWQPFGMESDGHWVRLRGGLLEHGDCCLSVTLRDSARVGLLALNDGVAADGVRLLPAGWMRESTRPSPASSGYGYYWWLREGGGYYASGSFGQHIEVHPASGTVVAVQSYWPAAYSEELISHNDAFVTALIDALR